MSLSIARRLRRAAIHFERQARAPITDNDTGTDTRALRLSLADLLRLHGDGSLPVLVMLLSLFTLIPVGGAGWFVSFFIAALGWSWARGREAVELPGALGRLSLNSRWTARSLHGLAWIYRRANRWLRPRWTVWRHERTRIWWGAWIALMAAIIFLPLPFGNVLPAMSLVLLGLGWMFRDGLALLAAGASGAGALAYTVAFGHLAIDLGMRGWAWMTG
ncbi:MAG: exopolysaccharide biosynthesis protein [Hydrogenophaga sp.]|uniref:exopolysaccharide biosynthesis protein n=1 Tax=Hydrogenophaga sp. TaxID=1904254 RepID=UPI001D9A7158|nr:exopolysaccharide biosynthesis protein [Hydrogenophaga sp.]MBX3609027.1 exopolysaccharide biosynthesis protein [Hydrogenophaga sp.]